MLRKVDVLGVVAVWIIVIVLILSSQQANAQGITPQITVCRSTTNFNPAQFEFRNIPTNWFEYDSNAPQWWYIAQGAGMDTVNHKLVADALDEEVNGFKVGTVALVDYTDNWTLVGNANTPLCSVPVVAVAAPISAPVAQVAQQPVSQPVVSSGKTCAIQYLKNNSVVLVCEG